jgi:signal transduction histidine kinase
MSGKIRARGSSGEPQADLARQLIGTIGERENELARLSRLLHNEVSQVLSAIGLQLDLMRMDFKEQTPAIEGRTAEIQAMLDQVIARLRTLSNELNPSAVERAGLRFALDELVGRTREKYHGNVRLHFDPFVRIPMPAAGVLYKIAECAVEGAFLRPGCSEVELQVKRQRHDIVLEIRHNGEAVDDPETLLPQLLMEHQAAQNRIALRVKNLPERGAVIRASYPEAVGQVEQ